MIKNLKTARNQLDLAAAQLDTQGHIELADKVDLCNAKLANASDEELKVITSVLKKINQEADRRNGKSAVASASPNRMAMQRRKALLRERLQKKVAAKKLEADLLDGLDLTASSERNEDALRMFRNTRIKKSRLAAQAALMAEEDD